MENLFLKMEKRRFAQFILFSGGKRKEVVGISY